ncbi:unnamed protein product [Brassica napus]|uniref:(rape) hypothetical protein n=1 Tax=Brassica napus TaxID=3708 RepID=A0A816INM2_BRANA|nr:unnamed protein product [Brassica napus]
MKYTEETTSRGWFDLKKAKSRYEFRCRTTAEEEEESISSVVVVTSRRNSCKLSSPNIEILLSKTLPSLQDHLLSHLIHGALRG